MLKSRRGHFRLCSTAEQKGVARIPNCNLGRLLEVEKAPEMVCAMLPATHAVDTAFCYSPRVRVSATREVIPFVTRRASKACSNWHKRLSDPNDWSRACASPSHLSTHFRVRRFLMSGGGMGRRSFSSSDDCIRERGTMARRPSPRATSH